MDQTSENIYMLFNASGKRMLSPNHRESFEGWKPQLDRLSLQETGNANTYYDAIRDELHREMDGATNSFVHSSWIPGTIWPAPYDKIYECLGDGQDPGQWNVARWFYGLLLQHVMIHRADQEWHAFPKTGDKDDPQGTLYQRK
jgi:hypothetical protein